LIAPSGDLLGDAHHLLTEEVDAPADEVVERRRGPPIGHRSRLDVSPRGEQQARGLAQPCASALCFGRHTGRPRQFGSIGREQPRSRIIADR
jgi:hypothetical protein